MGYVPLTSIGRTISQTHIASEEGLGALPPSGIDKYEIVEELAQAKAAFAVSSSDLSVLSALLSFHQGRVLGGNSDDLILFPSNKALSQRLNGMPDTTLRRHLRHLVEAGLLVRRDSPNGKRYRREDHEGAVAFGFDVTPLLVRQSEIVGAAQAARESAQRMRRLREDVSLMRRDVLGIVAYAAEEGMTPEGMMQYMDAAEDVRQALRRKLSVDELQSMKANLEKSLIVLTSWVEAGYPDDHFSCLTEEVDAKAVQNGRHYHNSNKESSEFEPSIENGRGGGVSSITSTRDTTSSLETANSSPSLQLDDRYAVGNSSSTDETGSIEQENHRSPDLPRIPLPLIMKACPDVEMYAQSKVEHWHQLVAAMDFVRGMLGVSQSAWIEAKQIMGPEIAAVTLAGILQRAGEIQSHGGYLRSLTNKAARGEFSCSPMIMALLNK